MTESYKFNKANMLKCDTMKFSNNQIRAIQQINLITEHFGEDRWFTQTEVVGAGHHTMEALVNKGVLQSQYFQNISYYQLLNHLEKY